MIMCKAAYEKSINSSVFPGNQGGPLMHIIAAKAVALKEAMTEDFCAYQRQVVANAKTLAAALKKHGLRLLTDGTDNHLLVVDLRGTEITGKAAQETLDQAHITVNRNAVPADPRPPFVTSGVRIGTPAVTTRGMKEAEMDLVGNLIVRALEKTGDSQALAAIADEVVDLCKRFPIYFHRLGS
jgi:glycine hydroxymethyltransferase